MVDRAHAGADRALDALGAVGVRHHPPPEVRGGRDDRVHLGLREVRLLRVVGRREVPARRGDLDHVGAGADHLTHLDRDALDAVAHAVGHPGIRRSPRASGAARQPGVAVAARHRDHRHRDLHPRPEQQPLLDRRLHAGVGAARVAHGRDAERDRPPHVLGHLVEAERERLVHHADLVEVLVREREVHVDVEEPRQERLARALDRPVAVEPRTHLDDPAVLDHHVGIGKRCARAIEHPPAGEHGPCHASPPRSGRDAGCAPPGASLHSA